MNLCFISYEYPPYILGGAGTYAKALVDGMKCNGVDVCIITNSNARYSNEKIFSVQTPNITYWRRLFFIKNALNMMVKLNNIYGFDIVHYNEPHLIPRKSDILSVSTIHSNQLHEIIMKINTYNKFNTIKDIEDLILKNTAGSISDLITVHNTEKIICPSPHLAHLIRRIYFVDKNKVHYIPNGIELRWFDDIKDDNKNNVLKKYNIKPQKYLFYIGRLSYLKGVHILIETFKDISKIYKDIKLLITGKGNRMEEMYLKNIAKDTKNIIFTGYINSMKIKKILYKNCLSVILPSFYEGLSMVILEAMACSKPIVACNVGGNRLLIKQGKNGFLIKPGDTKDLKKALNIIINNPKHSNKMGECSRKIVEKEFTSDVMVKETLNLYDMIL
ncbi:MAG: glycosyltransferase family 4 protein [Candidatus Hodarchaeota archaeon]